MTAPDDLDAGLDARLEFHPRWQVVVLAAAPWIVGFAPESLAEWLLLGPVLWTVRSGHRTREAR